MTKICTKCNKTLPLTSFHKNRSNKGGLRLQCKYCRNASYRSWRKANPHKVREQKYKNRYGISITEYNSLLKRQEYSCKICGINSPGRRNYFFVDHCHSTGRVRGLLCDNCNKGLGHFKDNISTLKMAIKYIKRE